MYKLNGDVERMFVCVSVCVRVCVVNWSERWRGKICRDDFIKIEIQVLYVNACWFYFPFSWLNIV